MTAAPCAAEDFAVTVNPAFQLPCGTVTLPGTTRAEFAEMPIARLPAEFDRIIVQLALAPIEMVVGVQASDVRLGVDQSDTVAPWVEAPRLAVTTAWVFERTLPAVATTVAVALPGRTVIVPGIESRVVLELKETAVATETACDSVIRQATVAAESTPAGLHTTPDTKTGATRPIVAVCELPPSVAVTVAL
jgi:hypothetical protein